MLGRLHFVLGLDGNVPSVGLSGNRHILGLALNEAASLVFDPADARQINLPSSFANLEVLREAERVRCHELLVLLREGRQTFEELLEGARQILERLLENLRVCFLKPGILLLPNQQFGAKLRVAETEGRIRCTTLFVLVQGPGRISAIRCATANVMGLLPRRICSKVSGEMLIFRAKIRGRIFR